MVLVYFTIADKIVKDSMESIYPAPGDGKMESPVIVGGMAIQLHCKDSINLLRPTSDIDLMYLPAIKNYNDFSNGIGGVVAKRVKESGYQVQLRRGRNELYEVKIMDGQNGNAKQLFFIHFDLPNKLAAHKIIPISEREIENAIEVPVGENMGLIKRIEDILPYKIERTRKCLDYENGSGLENALFKLASDANWRELAKTPLEDWLNHIVNTQNELVHGDKRLPGSYTISKDLYDMCLLARKIEGTPGSFNRAYYANARKEVESLGKK